MRSSPLPARKQTLVAVLALALLTLAATLAIPAPATASGVVEIAAGEFHTCALTSSATVKCWGDNGNGQLGDGTTTQRNTPVDVAGFVTGATDLDGGFGFTCARTTSAAMKCWGLNSLGQLGATSSDTCGLLACSLSPLDITGLGAKVVSIAAGRDHTCVALTTGGVKCWGNNEWGQLGDGTVCGVVCTAIDVPGVSGAVAVTGGQSHTCALTSGGGVKCWGLNDHGQLGDGGACGFACTAVDVSSLTSGVAAIAAGGSHTCALTTGSGVKCWGSNYSGQLGDGQTCSTSSCSSPVDVSGLTSGVGAIAAGNGHSCARLATGGLKCWGWNNEGQLGVTTSELCPEACSSTPEDVPLGSAKVVSFAAGQWHTCAIQAGGVAKCWGYNAAGQLGNGSKTDSTAPVTVSGLTPKAVGGITELADAATGRSSWPALAVTAALGALGLGMAAWLLVRGRRL